MQSYELEKNKSEVTSSYSKLAITEEHVNPDIEWADANTQLLAEEIIWLQGIIAQRVEEVEHQKSSQAIDFEQLPELVKGCSYTELIDEFNLSPIQRILLSIAFVAQYKPQLFEPMVRWASDDQQRRKHEFGGVLNRRTGQFIPTFQSSLFLLAGNNDALYAHYYQRLAFGNVLLKEHVLHLHQVDQFDRHLANYLLLIDTAFYHYILLGKKPRHDEVDHFPAQLLETDKTFDDLVLPKRILHQLEGPINFIKHQQSLYASGEVASKIKKGYVMMLHGPPGTGKTMTAAVIGGYLGVDVYCVNLAQVISKYIGETEKNLERIFDRLENKNCIIFFDEADALFGKRTEVSDAKDRYANQEVAYLLQRIEQCSSLVILASNFKQNLDDAFKRRILTYIFIGPPKPKERLIMWQKGLPDTFKYVPEDLPNQLAGQYAVTGAHISNILKLACIEAYSNASSEITHKILAPYIELEFQKENRS